jgi:hypothetical protein
VRRDLKERGYSVIEIRYDRDIDEQVKQNEDVFGESTR